ncbi:hypothetical protein T4B_12144 [Trichinella pseudospiralis]|uniref:Uncharacterized protein n=1 Tax=Trichinella pseudospiralis TaxID=6337 RepID=A0A0V1GPJ3_TRIPS|nr:hypothetical protein T4B_12144 [Trichinella pseudospiralis]
MESFINIKTKWILIDSEQFEKHNELIHIPSR